MPIACRRLLALAERDPRRAVRLARRALDRGLLADPLGAGWARYSLGWALLCWERPAQARPYLQQALALFAPGSLAALRCRHALLIADQIELARPDVAQDFAALAEEVEQAGDAAEAARIALGQARLLNVLGRADDAERVLRPIAPTLLRDGTPLDRARLLRVQGVAANIRNSFAEAQALLGRAERAFDALHNRLEVAKCWFEQAWVALRQEQVAVALAGYRRAEQVFTELDLPLQSAFCAKNIGLLLARQGAYDDALRALLLALLRFTQLHRARDIGGCLLNIGNIFFYSAQWDAALACYARAEAHYAATGVVGEQRTVRRNRAMVYRAQARHAEAQELLLDVEQQARAAGDQAEEAEVWAERAACLADRGELVAAMRLYRRARRQFRRLDSMLDAAECLVEQGWLALRRQRVGRAAAFFQAAAPVVAAHPYYAWRASYGLARCAAAGGDLDKALRHYRAASRTVAGLRRRLASEEISSGLYAQAEQLHADALDLAIAHGAIDTALEIGEEQRALVLQHLIATRADRLPTSDAAERATLRSAVSNLLGAHGGGADGAALDAALAAYGAQLAGARARPAPERALDATPDSAFDLPRLREQLGQAYGDAWTAITYVIGAERLLIGMITPAGAAFEQTPYDPELRRLLAQATHPPYRRMTYLDLAFHQGQNAVSWAGLAALGDRLIPGAVRARLHAQHRLLIVPAGPLHALPWAALRVGDQWLAERAIVQLAPSLAAWQLAASRPPAVSAAALLVGCSDYGPRGTPLPAVDAELSAVAAHWPGPAERLYNDQATCAALIGRSERGQLARLGLLHFAGHAQLLPARGRSAHLKLWDGDLLLGELAGLQLGSALVVLSACDGAAAEALPGEELWSLAWALLAAGAAGVLASLWPVYDGDAVALMAAFYQELRAHGDAALALALVQRRMLAAYARSEDPRMSPLYWGSFVFMGTAGSQARTGEPRTGNRRIEEPRAENQEPENHYS